MKLKLAVLASLALMAASAEAKPRLIIKPLAAELLANNHVVDIDVTITGDALKKFEIFEKKASEKRAEKKLAAFDPAAAMTARPDEDEYSTLPFATMFPLVMEDVTKEWGLTGGTPVKLKVAISELRTADAAMAMLIASSDQLTGIVTVVDPATDEELGEFMIDVVNGHSGWGGMLMRGGGIREKLAEEFALETSRVLAGRKSKKPKKA